MAVARTGGAKASKTHARAHGAPRGRLPRDRGGGGEPPPAPMLSGLTWKVEATLLAADAPTRLTFGGGEWVALPRAEEGAEAVLLAPKLKVACFSSTAGWEEGGWVRFCDESVGCVPGRAHRTVLLLLVYGRALLALLQLALPTTRLFTLPRVHQLFRPPSQRAIEGVVDAHRTQSDREAPVW